MTFDRCPGTASLVPMFLALALVACSGPSADANSAPSGAGGSGGGGSPGGSAGSPSGGGGSPPVIHAPGDERLLFVDREGAIQSAFTDGTEARPLTPAGWSCQTPAWSPDGKRIVFAATTPQSTHVELYVMGANGSAPLRVVSWLSSLVFDDILYPSWSVKDVIAFETRTYYSSGTATGVFTVAPDGTHLTELPIGENVGAPAWSPDGSQLALRLGGAGSSDLWVWRGPGDLSRVAGPFSGTLTPAWTPADDWIVYSRSDHGGEAFGLFRIHPDGTGPSQLATPAGDVGRPSVSRDGRTVAFDVFKGEPSSFEIDTLTLDLGTPARLMPRVSDPQYQP